MPETINDRFDKKFLDSEESDFGGTDYYLNDEANEITPIKSFIAEELDEIEKRIEAKIKKDGGVYSEGRNSGLRHALAIIRERRGKPASSLLKSL